MPQMKIGASRRSPGRARGRLAESRDQPVDKAVPAPPGRSRVARAFAARLIGRGISGESLVIGAQPVERRAEREAEVGARVAVSARRAIAARSRSRSGSSGPERAATPASRASAMASAGSTASARS